MNFQQVVKKYWPYILLVVVILVVLMMKNNQNFNKTTSRFNQRGAISRFGAAAGPGGASTTTQVPAAVTGEIFRIKISNLPSSATAVSSAMGSSVTGGAAGFGAWIFYIKDLGKSTSFTAPAQMTSDIIAGPTNIINQPSVAGSGYYYAYGSSTATYTPGAPTAPTGSSTNLTVGITSAAIQSGITLTPGNYYVVGVAIMNDQPYSDAVGTTVATDQLCCRIGPFSFSSPVQYSGVLSAPSITVSVVMTNAPQLKV